MFHLDADLKVYQHREAVDFRKSINGLATLVEQSMGRDPLARAVYAFRNRRWDRIKLLLYNRTGFWLLIKRLEQDCFVSPRREEGVLELTAEQLHWLLDSSDIEVLQRHLARQYQHVG